jgi:hypothetical protein
MPWCIPDGTQRKSFLYHLTLVSALSNCLLLRWSNSSFNIPAEFANWGSRKIPTSGNTCSQTVPPSVYHAWWLLLSIHFNPLNFLCPIFINISFAQVVLCGKYHDYMWSNACYQKKNWLNSYIQRYYRWIPPDSTCWTITIWWWRIYTIFSTT